MHLANVKVIVSKTLRYLYITYDKLFWIDNLQTPKLTFQLSHIFILFTRKLDYTHMNSKCDSSIIDAHNWSSNINLRLLIVTFNAFRPTAPVCGYI